MVDIGLRVLYRPDPGQIGIIAQTIGEDFSDKVLPSIIHDTLKSVMAQYNASSLLTKRNEVKKHSSICSLNFLKNRFLQQLEMISSSVPVTSTLSLTTLRSPIRSSVLSSLNQLKTNRLRSSKHSRRNSLFNKLWRRRSRKLSLPRERRNRE